MITITDGSTQYNVTRGAYETIYKGMGFYPVGQEPSVQSTGGVTTVAESVANNESGQADVEDTAEADGAFEVEEPAASEDEKWCEAIRQKPITQWSKQDLKKYADINGVDLSGAKTVNDVRSRIASSWS